MNILDIEIEIKHQNIEIIIIRKICWEVFIIEYIERINVKIFALSSFFL